jgi:hypothetical protein
LLKKGEVIMSMSIQQVGLGRSTPVTGAEPGSGDGGADRVKQLIDKLAREADRIFRLLSKLLGSQGDDAPSDPQGNGRPTGGAGDGGQPGGGSGGGCSGAGSGGNPSGGAPASGDDAARPRSAEASAPSGQGEKASASSGTGNKALIDEINRVRREHGLNPVTEAPNLNRAAAQNNEAQQSQGLGHHVPLGNNGASGEIAFEASDGATPQNSVRGWLDSEDHRKILLDPEMTHVGVDMSGRYSTADFSRATPAA